MRCWAAQLQHGVLLEKRRKLEAIEEKVQQAQVRMERYHNLPPNLQQAKAALAEKQQQLLCKRQELEEGLAQL